MWKLLTRAFQWCILRGGQHLVEVSQNEDFLQKTAWKTAFLADTKLDQLTLEGAGTPNYKSTDIFDMNPENLGAKAFRWDITKPAGVNIVQIKIGQFHLIRHYLTTFTFGQLWEWLDYISWQCVLTFPYSKIILQVFSNFVSPGLFCH